MKSKTQSSLACLVYAIVVLNIVPSVSCISKLNTLKKPANLKQYLDNFNDPVIGILTQPLSPYFKRYFGIQYRAYIPSSYKKWVEQTGARAVIIPHFISLKRIEKLFGQVNGLVLPGGRTNLKKKG